MNLYAPYNPYVAKTELDVKKHFGRFLAAR
jgi:hypothetical protein